MLYYYLMVEVVVVVVVVVVVDIRWLFLEFEDFFMSCL
jgi:hypothetical protein